MTSACTILCSEADFGKVLEAVRASKVGEISVDGTPQKWSRITVVFPSSRLTFSSLIQEQAGDEFSRLVLSMLNYFDRVETDMESNKNYVITRIESVKMMVGVVAEPEFLEDDSRLNVLWRIVETIDALVFNGDAILDLQGQRILDRNGKFDVIVE